MNKLRRLTSVVVLTLLLGLTVFAGETQTPPCAEPIPGETQTPPCVAAPGDVDTPTVSSTASAASETFALVTEVAADVLESMLSIF